MQWIKPVEAQGPGATMDAYFSNTGNSTTVNVYYDFYRGNGTYIGGSVLYVGTGDNVRTPTYNDSIDWGSYYVIWTPVKAEAAAAGDVNCQDPRTSLENPVFNFAYSVNISFTCNIPVVSPPGAFNGLSATASCSGGSAQIAFSWGSSSGASSYGIYWSVGGNPRSTSAQVTTGGTSYTQGGFSTGVTVNWDIRANNSGGSTWTSTGYYAVTTPSTCSPPGSFTGISATSTCSGGSSTVTFTWNTSSGATSYNLSWEVSPGNPRTTGTDVAVGSTSRVQSGFTPGVTINWDVQASNGVGLTWTSNGYYSHTVATCTTPPTVNILANSSNGPITVATNSTVTLSWTTTNSPTSCTASNSWTGAKATGGSSENRVVSTNSTFTITCSNAAGSGSDSVTVNVGSAPGVDLLVNGGNGPVTVASGGSVTLSWTTTNSPTSCTASNGWSGAKSTGGSSESVTVFSNSTYTLTCSNAIGSNADSVSVTIGAAPTVNLTANGSGGPITVGTGSSVTLAWSTTGSPSSCTASNAWSGSKATGGSSENVTVSANSTYTLSCTNGFGSGNDSVVVNVSGSAPTVNVTANGSNGPISVATGSTVTIAWTTTNSPTSCTASNGWTGAKATGGGTENRVVNSNSTFSLSCSNASGSGSDSVVVNVITTGDISIRVRAADLNGFIAGQFVSGATVRLLDTANNPISSCTSPASCIATSDASGWVNFTGVPAGQVRMAGYMAGYDGRYKQTEGDCASATPGVVVSTHGPNANTSNLLAALDDSFTVPAGVTSGCNDLGLVKKPNYSLTWNLPGGAIETNPSVGANYSLSINPTNCTPGVSWPGTLTVNLTFSISPNDGNVAGLPGATPISLNCSGSQTLPFTLTPNASVTRGATYNLTVTGNSSGITAPQPPSPIGVLGSQPVTLGGTLSISDGNWLRTQRGDFYSYGPVSFSAAPPSGFRSSDFLVKTGTGTRGNASSSAPWYAENYGPISIPVSYDTLRALVPATLNNLPNCSQKPTSGDVGAFQCSGNVTVNAAAPSLLARIQTLVQSGWRFGQNQLSSLGKLIAHYSPLRFEGVKEAQAQEKTGEVKASGSITVYSPAADGDVRSFNNDYATMRNGTNKLQASTPFFMNSGQQSGTTFCTTSYQYCAYESFLEFDTSSVPDNATITSVLLTVNGTSSGSSPLPAHEVRLRDWGGTVDVSDWVAGSSLSTLTRLATFGGSFASGPVIATEDGQNFRNNINKTGMTRVMITTAQLAAGTVPTGDSKGMFSSGNGSTNQPSLTVNYTTPDPNIYVTGLKLVPTSSGCSAAGQTNFVAGTTVTVCGTYGNNGSLISPSIWLSVYKNRATQPPINTVGDAVDTNAGAYSAGFASAPNSNIATFVTDSSICTTCTAGVFFDSRGAATENSETDNWGTVAYTLTIPGPTVVTNPESNPSANSMTLNGSANPNGVASTGWFRYSTTNPGTCNDTFGTRVPSSGGTSLGSGNVSQNFSQTASGLIGNTTYYYCALANNGTVTNVGAMEPFTTDAVSGPLGQTVVFVEGNLVINTDIVTLGTAQVLVYIVNGRVTINNNVTRVDAYIFAEQGIETTNNAAVDAAPLTINGGVAVGNCDDVSCVINFNRNLITPTYNPQTTPAETIVYDPRVMIALSDPNSPLLALNSVTFSEASP